MTAAADRLRVRGSSGVDNIYARVDTPTSEARNTRTDHEGPNQHHRAKSTSRNGTPSTLRTRRPPRSARPSSRWPMTQSSRRSRTCQSKSSDPRRSGGHPRGDRRDPSSADREREATCLETRPGLVGDTGRGRPLRSGLQPLVPTLGSFEGGADSSSASVRPTSPRPARTTRAWPSLRCGTRPTSMKSRVASLLHVKGRGCGTAIGHTSHAPSSQVNVDFAGYVPAPPLPRQEGQRGRPGR